ncbi:hypothetical protein SFRURICE_010703 [Spodoptera frugiperda]|nr:hypothetical protein SFRURICE_010703 [Spodoptera frugiperda]
MDVNTFLIFYWYYRRRQRNRRFWVHPILTQRSNLGIFRNLMSDLRRDESKFFNYFRMSMTTFDDLLKRVNEDLKKHDTNMRKSITPEEKLAICLRYLASGCSYMDLHYAYRVGVSTINSIIVEWELYLGKTKQYKDKRNKYKNLP